LPAQCGSNLRGNLLEHPHGLIQSGKNGIELENQLGGVSQHLIRLQAGHDFFRVAVGEGRPSPANGSKSRGEKNGACFYLVNALTY